MWSSTGKSIATYKPIRTSDFEMINIPGKWFPKLFGTNHPTGRNCRKEFKTATGRQTFTTIVTKVELNQIAISIVISDTTGITLITIRQCIFAIFAHHIHHHSRHVMVAEATPPVQTCIEIESLVGITSYSRLREKPITSLQHLKFILISIRIPRTVFRFIEIRLYFTIIRRL